MRELFRLACAPLYWLIETLDPIAEVAVWVVAGIGALALLGYVLSLL